MSTRSWPLRKGVVLALLGCAIGRTADSADIGVNDTGDILHAPGCALNGTGACTLRDAITFANSNPGLDNIWLPAGVIVRPASALPEVSDAANLTVPGGFTPFVIDGSQAGPADGLTLRSGSKVLGVEVRRFEGSGIVILGSGNQIGAAPICIPLCPLSPLPVSVTANVGHGIEVRGGSDNRLRFVSATLNGGNGIYLWGGTTSNLVGELEGPISGSAVGNRLAGIRIGAGPSDVATQGNTVRAQGLRGNGGLGIDLGGDGVTPNDAVDADTGPNGLQNFPTTAVVTTTTGNMANVSGTFAGAANAAFTLSFYQADTGRPLFESTVPIATDAIGTATFSATLPFPAGATGPSPGTAIPAVATATDALGNTSELSGPLTSTPPPQALALHPVPPCRLVDTREPEVAPAGPYGGPALINGRPRRFSVPPSGTPPCNSIPSTARALVLNVTVTNATAGGHVLVAPSPWATDTSTVNFQAGQTRANSAVATLDAGAFAAIAVLEGPLSGTVDLILDVSGYFE